MEMYEFISPCHFGMEAVLKREIYDLGYDIIKTEDGRVTFEGDAEAVCRANVNLRTTERVLLKAGEFHAETFDELFEAVKALPWGAVFAGGRQVLGGQGILCQKQAVQSV